MFLLVSVSLSSMPKRAGDWQRVARLVLARRVAIERNREKFAETIKMSSRTISDIERGRRDSYGEGTLALLEHALNWQPRLRKLRADIIESELLTPAQKEAMLAEMDRRLPPHDPRAGTTAAG